MTSPETGRGSRPASSLFGFAPGGVYRAAAVARGAVGSYPTLSPLPRRHSRRPATGMQAGRFAFCGTVPGVAPAGRYPAPCFRGARTFLTSPPFGIAKRGCPAGWQRSDRRNDLKLRAFSLTCRIRIGRKDLPGQHRQFGGSRPGGFPRQPGYPMILRTFLQ